MKVKFVLVVVASAVLVFFTAQSFFLQFQKHDTNLPQTWFKPLPGHAVICTPIYNPADSLIDIPALKGWGNYKWKISAASDSVQYYFNQGISLYYGFHTIESIASFTKATHIDPTCAMAWYGKALALGPTINYENGYRPPADAYDAALKSKALMANCTPLEKDLIEAIQHRYRPDSAVSVKQLRMNYAEAMKDVYAKHPEDADVITLYADALLLLHPWDLYDHEFKPKPWTAGIRMLLEKAIAISPKHPGANHYYIHTMEGSATPELALNSAHLLDTLMPLVSHMTHMPSHIYIRTGSYQRGVKVNIDAIAGYNTYLKQYSPVENGNALYELHNIHLKVNCAQMAGNYKIATEGSALLRNKVLSYLGLKDKYSSFIQYLYVQPLFTELRFGKWDDILNEKPADSLVFASAIQHFTRGMAFCALGKLTEAQQEYNNLQTKMKDPLLKIGQDNFSTPFEALQVADFILKGRIAEVQHNYIQAITDFEKAVVAEDNLIYDEPRDWPIPAREYLASAFLKAGKFDEALPVLQKDLAINPNNGWSLNGLQTVYMVKNNAIALESTKKQLKAAWSIRDLIIDGVVY